jgi:hypothetical protein
VSADAVPIDAMLRELGHSSGPSRAAARRVLEEAGLTNPRKRNISGSKRAVVEAELAARLVRTCGTERCERATAADLRPRALVDKPACEVCGGSDNAAAVARMAAAMQASGRTRLLVVGGGPDSQAELRRLLAGTAVELQIVDGAVAVGARRAQAWAEAADVIAVWGGTILAHKVSSHFTVPAYRPRRVTAMQRGIAALADAVVAHLDGGRAG